MDSLYALAKLARAPSFTAEHLRALVTATGSLEAASNIGAAGVPGVDLPRSTREFFAAPDEAAIGADLDWIQSRNCKLVPCTSPEYPVLLAHTSRAPAVLYVLGNVPALHTPQLAIVGSRSPTASGRETARAFAEHFARAGITITSGLALGIDAASHEGALLAEGRTVAVCGTGLDIVYPRQNLMLARRIEERGAIVSEFPPRTRALAPHFPKRNRIISGLSFGTLVVEAAQGSGSLITANHATEQGREVFAIPGSIHSPLSRGCHQLIRTGAKLVESAEDVLVEVLNFLQPQSLASCEPRLAEVGGAAPPLDKEYEILLDALGFEPASIDVLVARTGFPSDSVTSMLLILELQGRLAPHAGGRYARLPTSGRPRRRLG
jgi:DNA processing protein